MKAGKNVSNGKYHDMKTERPFYDWLMFNVAAKVEGEKRKNTIFARVSENA